MKIQQRIITMLCEREIVHDYVSEYGEPGYKLPDGHGDNACVLLGNMWCEKKDCSFTEVYEEPRSDAGKKKIHSVEYHYPRIFQALEDQGFQFEWYDEWYVDDEGDKCYRTTEDSYMWQPSTMWSEVEQEILTPEDDIEMWIDAVKNNPKMCLPSVVWKDTNLIEAGFTEYQCDFASGWFEGMNDDPVKITEGIRKFSEEEVDIVFQLSESSQFYIKFCVWTRPKNYGGHED